MIKIIPIKNFDGENYNFIRCPVSKHKIGWKHKNTKVRIISLPKDAEYNIEGFIVYCKHCNTCCLIITENQ